MKSVDKRDVPPGSVDRVTPRTAPRARGIRRRVDPELDTVRDDVHNNNRLIRDIFRMGREDLTDRYDDPPQNPRGTKIG